MSSHWICAQLGAREHYAIPRALQASGQLEALLTDAWMKPGRLLAELHGPLRERYHPDLATASVTSWSRDLLTFELQARVRRPTPWSLIMARNRWFQRRIVAALAAFTQEKSSPPIFFSYSYAALEALRLAQKRGWRTVLGQIDPGPVEERLVGKLHQPQPRTGSSWIAAPKEYWQSWREECALADHIVVNSEWSRLALLEEGVSAEKLIVIPLAYQAPVASLGFPRTYPEAFTEQRPLRVLFLGQINLRKGAAEVMEAMRLLRNRPVEFRMVGRPELEIPLDLRICSRVRWIGAVPRSAVAAHYQWADVFLFPTFSDGFGLTQLEAQAWKLPVIASRFCGEVVEHGSNGWLLPEVTGEAIARQVSECADHPRQLAVASVKSGLSPRHTLSAVGAALSRLASR
jgi:glycosyltransferase involved in cell wall biosynthesis